MTNPAGPAASAARIAEAPTVIDAGASFEGLLTFRGSARVDGVLTGRVVASGCLVIGPRGKVAATVEVDELVVGGELEGDVVARSRVELLASGRVSGHLRAPRFALADGCRFDGRWETAGPPPQAPRAAVDEPAAPLLEGTSAP